MATSSTSPQASSSARYGPSPAPKHPLHDALTYNLPLRPAIARFTGCLACRAKKIRCDGAHPVCGTCHKGNRDSECVYEETPADGKRRRVSQKQVRELEEKLGEFQSCTPLPSVVLLVAIVVDRCPRSRTTLTPRPRVLVATLAPQPACNTKSLDCPHPSTTSQHQSNLLTQNFRPSLLARAGPPEPSTTSMASARPCSTRADPRLRPVRATRPSRPPRPPLLPTTPTRRAPLPSTPLRRPVLLRPSTSSPAVTRPGSPPPSPSTASSSCTSPRVTPARPCSPPTASSTV